MPTTRNGFLGGRAERRARSSARPLIGVARLR